MEDIVCKFGLYNIESLHEDARQYVSLIVQMTAQINELFEALPDSKNEGRARDAIININNLENQGDILFRDSLARLFREEKDPVEIIKWKDIYELLEDTLDAGEHLADTAEGILAKYA